MKLAAFVSGLCIGMVAGATVDRMTSDRKARRAVSKTMERRGMARDRAFEDVTRCLQSTNARRMGWPWGGLFCT